MKTKIYYNSTEIEIEVPDSVLTKSQRHKYGPKVYTEDGQTYKITANVRHDDQCGNGHNSFSITADIYEKDERGRWRESSAGCCHDEVAKHFPKLAPFIKWHLTSTDGPMHYLSNTIYHATEHGPKSAWVYFDDPPNGIKKQCVKYCDISEAHEMCQIPSKTFNYVSGVGYRLEADPKTAKVANLDWARSSAVWPKATKGQLLDKDALLARLPALMAEFKKDVESLGFIY